MNTEEKIEETLYREGLSVAPILPRFIAYLIDNLLISLVVVIIYWDSFQNAIATSNTEELLMVTRYTMGTTWTLTILYQWLFVAFYGATVGKIICKIKIIDYSILDKPSFLNAFIRAIVRVLGEYCMYLSFLIAFYYKSRRTLHDILAKTVVVRAY